MQAREALCWRRGGGQADRLAARDRQHRARRRPRELTRVSWSGLAPLNSTDVVVLLRVQRKL
jgi:hypothetical protein